MNIHNKTHATYARINLVLKDSSCDTPLPKTLMLTILGTNAISNLTTISDHTKDDSIFKHKGQLI